MPMTMQVGMVGSDGIVLASDTKVWLVHMWRTITSGLVKIRIGCNRKIAVSCPYDTRIAFRIADAILTHLLPEVWSSPEDRMRQIILSELDALGADSHECMIVLSEPKPTLHLFSSGQKKDDKWDDPLCAEVPTYAFCGHLTNAACRLRRSTQHLRAV
jgi:hypothetical protein